VRWSQWMRWSQWFRQPVEDQRCVFLRNNECGIYAGRPANCRKHFSLDEPEKCNPVVSQSIKRWVSPMAEGVYSAVMNLFTIGPMPHALLRARDAK
jgi:Fe-S-cluster containining protein